MENTQQERNIYNDYTQQTSQESSYSFSNPNAVPSTRLHPVPPSFLTNQAQVSLPKLHFLAPENPAHYLRACALLILLKDPRNQRARESELAALLGLTEPKISTLNYFIVSGCQNPCSVATLMTVLLLNARYDGTFIDKHINYFRQFIEPNLYCLKARKPQPHRDTTDRHDAQEFAYSTQYLFRAIEQDAQNCDFKSSSPSPVSTDFSSFTPSPIRTDFSKFTSSPTSTDFSKFTPSPIRSDFSSFTLYPQSQYFFEKIPSPDNPWGFPKDDSNTRGLSINPTNAWESRPFNTLNNKHIPFQEHAGFGKQGTFQQPRLGPSESARPNKIVFHTPFEIPNAQKTHDVGNKERTGPLSKPMASFLFFPKNRSNKATQDSALTVLNADSLSENPKASTISTPDFDDFLKDFKPRKSDDASAFASPSSFFSPLTPLNISPLTLPESSFFKW